MPNTPKMEAARYPWLLTLTREVCEALTRPAARERFGEKLLEWYETRAPEPDDSADDFLDDNPGRTASRYFLPTTGTLTLADKYARVAAIHDAVCERCEEINPWPVTDLETAPFEDAARCMAFTVLKGWVTPRDLPDTPDVRNRVTGIWSDVRDDLNVSPTARLLGALADADERGRALAELPRELLDPKLLHDCDALGWIEFGNRDSIFLNTEHGPRRKLENGWSFGRRTLPGYKQMPDIINEALRDDAEDPDVKAYPDLRTHVRVTAAGRTELARLRMNLAASVQPATAGDAKPEAAGGGTRSRQRRNRRHVEQAGLTLLQTEAVQIVGACKGNIAEAARRLGKDRKTVKQHYEAGLRKLGRAAPGKPKTQRLATDRRGQVSESHDRRLD